MFRQEKSKQEKPDFEYFVYYDSKVGCYDIPMIAINRHDLVREIDRLFRDPKQSTNKLLTNAEDFSIFKIGTYSKKTGELVGCKPEHIANLHDIRSAVMRSIPLRNDTPQQLRDVAQTEMKGIEAT